MSKKDRILVGLMIAMIVAAALIICEAAKSQEPETTEVERQYAAELEVYLGSLREQVAAKATRLRVPLKPGVGYISPEWAIRERDSQGGCQALCALPCDPKRSPAGCLGSSCAWRIDRDVRLSGVPPVNPQIGEIVAAFGARAGGCSWIGYSGELFHANEAALRAGWLLGAWGGGYDGNPQWWEIYSLMVSERKGQGTYAQYLPAPPRDRDGDGVPDATDRCPDVIGMYFPPSSPHPSGCPLTSTPSVPDSCPPEHEVITFADARCARAGLPEVARMVCALRAAVPNDLERQLFCELREWWREKEGAP